MGLIGHVIQRPGVIEHRQGVLVESFVGRIDADKVGHDRIDGGGLAEGPRNYWGVFAS